MQVLPSAESLRVLVAWSQVVAKQRRWVQLTPSEVPELAGLDAAVIQSCVQELTEKGCCTPAAHGDLHYISRPGATLARAVRELLEQGCELTDLTPAVLGPKLIRFPYIFRDAVGFAPLRSAGSARPTEQTLAF